MIEALLGLGLMLGLFGLALVASALALDALLMTSAVLALGGLLLCLPCGLGYHVFMHRGLRERGPIPAGWYWAPVRHHRDLSRPAFRRVLPFVVGGATGVVLAFVGCALALIWVMRV